MERKRILVVDDEQDLCDILTFNLAAAGYDACAAYSAEEAMEAMGIQDKEEGGGTDGSQPLPHLLLLDVMMPGMNGFEMAERLKADAHTAAIPIIFLTARDTEDDTLRGFNLGADDYVTKPFSVREVIARVKAVLSRSNSARQDTAATLRHEGLLMDTGKKTVTIDGEESGMTKTEFELLHMLLAHRGQVLTRQQLLEGAWPKDVIVTDRTVDVNITRMRKKMGHYGACIVARQGFGYVFEDQGKAKAEEGRL